MKTSGVNSLQIDDLEAGCAISLFLAAAGCEVETTFDNGTAFLFADSHAAELGGVENSHDILELANQLRERLNRHPQEAEIALLTNQLPIVA